MNAAWWSQFPDFSVSHLLHSISDHCSILMSTKNLEKNNIEIGRMGFKFYANWVLEKECENIVREFWTSHSDSLP